MKVTSIKDMRVLVTGGAGFVGSNLAIALVEAGAQVRILDNLSTGKLNNLEGYQDSIEFIDGDILDDIALDKAVNGIEIVFHQAALPSVPRSIENPLASELVNAQGTLKVLIASRNASIRRLIYASSSSVYGNSPILPKHEKLPVDPKSPYALSKYSGERYCQLFFQLYALETVCLRYFNVFGPRQDPESQYAAVIPMFINHIIRGKPLTIYGDGNQTRDFTYIGNVIDANLLAVFADNAAGEVINIACGDSITINELAEYLMSILRKKVNVESAPQRLGEVRDSLASISKAEKICEYRPRTTVWEGLQNTCSWYTTHLPGSYH